MVMRPAIDGDFEAIAALTNLYIRETAIHFGEVPVSADELLDLRQRDGAHFPYLVAIADESDRVHSTVERQVSPSADFNTVRAGCGGQLLGYAKAGPWRTRAAYRFTAEVGIYLWPEAQGAGRGTALYGALIAACREAGFHALIGGVTIPNDSSIRLHERLGFERIGVFPEVGFKFGRWHAVGFWQLRL
ncbi:MAG: N-acetyltransferase [Phycisphaeraceae bacterium]|nr:N-acetyltransferase [Phycisphaeraceae bacterium]